MGVKGMELQSFVDDGQMQVQMIIQRVGLLQMII